MQLDPWALRRDRLASWMNDNGTDAVVIHDTEGRRTANLRYISGMPMDAILIILKTGRSILIPWDINLAGQKAVADEIIPQEAFNRNSSTAIVSILRDQFSDSKATVELSATTPYPLVCSLKEQLPEYTLISRTGGMDDVLLKLRMIKDNNEQELYRRACGATDQIIDFIEENWFSFKTEADIAMGIESNGRELGAEGMGFESIVAGPSRSFGIHAFPSYTGESISSPGLTIIDFGLIFEGYTSDVTLTVARGNLSREQEELLCLVQEAYEGAVDCAAPGKSTQEIAAETTRFFRAKNRRMPHSLGHGIGLEAHEYPFLRDTGNDGMTLEPGMIITIEPGLYDPDTGGARLENDFLVTSQGIERLTNSRILRMK